MPLELTGKHLIAGEWVAGRTAFHSDPASGTKREFAVGTADERGIDLSTICR